MLYLYKMIKTQETKKIQFKPKKLKVIDFCNKNKIPYVLFNLTIDKEKSEKFVKEIPSGWKDLNYNECMDQYNNNRLNKTTYFNALAINLWKANMMVVDLDNEKNYKQKLEIYGKRWQTKSTRRRLPHLWFKKDINDKNSNKIGLESGVDLVYHIVFECINSTFSFTKENMKTFTEYPAPILKNIAAAKNSQNVPVCADDDVLTAQPSFNITPEQKEIIDNIDVKYINNYESWLRIIWSLYNTFKNVDICDYISQKGDSYKNKCNVWKFIKCDKTKQLTFGTIAYYSKISNETKHYKIRNKYNQQIINGDDMSLAQLYLDITGDDIISYNNQYFIYKDPYWELLDKKHNYLKKNINEIIFKCVSIEIDRLIEECKTNNDDLDALQVKLKECFKLRSTINSLHKIKSMTECVLLKIENNNSYKVDNVKPNYFCFKNIAFDMKTRKQVKVNKYDYISNHTGYNYVEPTLTEIHTMDNIIDSIMPVAEQKKCLLSILRLGCIGKQNEYFCYFNGGGSNGKGLMMENLNECLGNYYGTSNTELLVKPIKEGCNTTFRNLHQKRFVVFSEPEEDQKILGGNLKKITANPIHTGRGLYEDEMEIQLHNITVVECNSRPEIKGQMTNAYKRRIVDLEFSQTFTFDKDEAELPNYHLATAEYKSYDFIQQHKYALFKILLNSECDDIYIPQEVKNRSNKFLMDSDSLNNWIHENYYFTNNDKDKIVMRDIFNEFKQGDFYNNLTMIEKRTIWNKKKFIENITNHIHFKQLITIKTNGSIFLTKYKKKDDNNAIVDFM